MPQPYPPLPQSLDDAEVVFLGTGTSVGVPSIGCECNVCLSDDPRNQRSRCSIVLRLPTGNLLVDTPPDLRTQLLRERVGIIDAVLYTHEHADHLFGLDDLRLFPFRLGHPVPLYARSDVEQRIRKSYDYAFSDHVPTHAGATPSLQFVSIDDTPFEVLGIEVVPIPLKHGPRFEVLGFRFGDFAYCTDTNFVSDESMEKLAGVQTLVLDALRVRPHATHFCIDEALAVIDRLKPKQTYLTHICHDLDHQTTNSTLPPGVQLAFDGLRLPLR